MTTTEKLFRFDGIVSTLAAMQAANKHDPEFCAWLTTAAIGDTLDGCWRLHDAPADAARTHHFYSSREAYDACQCDERVRDGDTLLIATEHVVGVADTWPFAVSKASGSLHTPITDEALAELRSIPVQCIKAARELAASYGY